MTALQFSLTLSLLLRTNLPARADARQSNHCRRSRAGREDRLTARTSKFGLTCALLALTDINLTLTWKLPASGRIGLDLRRVSCANLCETVI
jgi:hypothetical protein